MANRTSTACTHPTSARSGSAKTTPTRTLVTSCSPTGVNTPTSFSKITTDGVGSHGLDTRVACVFNTYGPRMRTDDGRVIPTFVRQALTGGNLTVSGDGTGSRRFCPISDPIDGLQQLFGADVQTPINIGNPDERTILELAEIILHLMDSDSTIMHEPLPPQDQQVQQPDIAKAHSELGWEPDVSLRDGLRESIAYFRSVV